MLSKGDEIALPVQTTVFARSISYWPASTAKLREMDPRLYPQEPEPNS